MPEAAAQRLQRLDLLAEVIDRPKRRRLGLQPDHQFGRLDAGKTGNVVDRLFGIERRALPPGIVKHVDNVAIEPDHAALEDGKQSRGPRAYNDDVGLMRMSGGHIPTVAKMMPKIKAPGDWIVRGPEFGSWGRNFSHVSGGNNPSLNPLKLKYKRISIPVWLHYVSSCFHRWWERSGTDGDGWH